MPRDLLRGAFHGALAGAAGTAALNAVTHADMALRGRPASSTPEDTVAALARGAGIVVPGGESARRARLQGLGALGGLAAGVATGAVYGGVRALGWRPGAAGGAVATTAAAMVAGNGPMTVLRVTDPRAWSAASWASDVLPHVAFGVVTSTAMGAMDSDAPRRPG